MTNSQWPWSSRILGDAGDDAAASMMMQVIVLHQSKCVGLLVEVLSKQAVLDQFRSVGRLIG